MLSQKRVVVSIGNQQDLFKKKNIKGMVYMTQIHDHQYLNRYKLMSLVFALTTILLIVVGATIWILNIEKVINGSWSSIFGVVFTVFGVALSFLQWHTQSSNKVPTQAPASLTRRLSQQVHQAQIEGTISGV